MKENKHHKLKERRIMMRKRIVTLLTALTMLCSAVAPGMEIQAAQAKAGTSGTTYYVSTIHGKDSNSGTSQSAPFYSLQKINHLDLGPGDKVLLECGSVFKNGYLHLFGQSGSEEDPIVIDQYGTGADPIIDTNGQGIWFQNYGQRLDNTWHQYQGYVSSSILLYDSEYVEIQNLEIVNQNPGIDTVYNATDMMDRTGVAAVAQDAGTISHIHLKNLNIHDILGNVYNKHMNNGGIYFTVYLPHDAQMTNKSDNKGTFVSSQTGIPRFDDVLIEGCSVARTDRWGIAVGYTALWEIFANKKNINDEDISTYGTTNVVIRNNYVKDVGGDAITLMYCDRPLTEYNVSDGAGQHMNPVDYLTGTQRFSAGIWPWKCKDPVFQYNEVFDMQSKYDPNGGNGDGQAWDVDWTDGALYQYNYSHHNAGGCVLFCLNEAYRGTFRYNVSQDDLKCVLTMQGNLQAHVYNNTFYVAEGVRVYHPNDGKAGGPAVVENNIFYYSGDTPKQEDWTIGNNKTYHNNLYYNYANTPDDAAGIDVAKGTQIFEDPGTAPSSAADTGKARIHNNPEVASVFDGYKLSENSLAIGEGKVVTDANNFDPSELDFFGNDLTDVTVFDIGAHQYQDKTGTPRPQKPSQSEVGEITENVAEISWPVAENSDEIQGYKIKNGNEDVKVLTGDELASAIKDGVITVAIDGLDTGTKYTLTIVAYDANGTESLPRASTFTTAGLQKPSAPSQDDIVINDNEATISWKAPANMDGIAGYMVKDGDKVLKKLTSADLASAIKNGKITVTVDGLSAGTEYTLAIVAYDDKNKESSPQMISIKTTGTKLQKPSKPAQPSVSGFKQTGATVSWKASSEAVTGYKIMNGSQELLDLTGQSLVNATKAGTVTVTLSNLSAGKKYNLSLIAYNAAGDSEAIAFSFTTLNAIVSTPSIKLNQKTLTLYTKVAKMKSATLNATVSNASGAVTWTSSKPAVAEVKNGTVTAKKAGKTVITATIGGVKAECTVTVKNPTITVKKSVTVKRGKKVKLKVTVAPKGKVTYKTSKKKIATVTKKGVIKGIKKGSCNITVRCNGVTRKVKVKVK